MTHVVRCNTCHPHGSNRPLEIPELCEACAEDTANAHKARGHDVTILTTNDVIRHHLNDPNTQRLMRRKVG